MMNHSSTVCEAKPPLRAGERRDLPAEREGNLLLAEPEVKTRRPPLFRVVLLNDDYTPMEFVVHVLEAIFHKPNDEATRIMLDVHRKGAGICGVYTREVAETKVEQVIGYAQAHEHPLQCLMEKE